MARFFKFLGFIIVIGMVLSMVSCSMALFGLIKNESKVAKDSILFLKLEGVIIDGDKFLKDLKKYRELDSIKGVLIQVNSPGGVVGPSQEIYSELVKTRVEYKKPVVVSGLGLMASGAFYSAVAADKIVVNPGTLVGSIGVIMEFANLQKLYEWAKVKRFAITTGNYKDTGAEYREMREDERKLIESMMSDVLMQFKTAISEGRKIPLDKISEYSDGRVFTGSKAVELGLADQIGTLSDATKLISELSGIDHKPDLFIPPKDKEDFLEYILSEDMGSHLGLTNVFSNTLQKHLKLYGQPLFLMPGHF